MKERDLIKKLSDRSEVLSTSWGELQGPMSFEETIRELDLCRSHGMRPDLLVSLEAVLDVLKNERIIKPELDPS